MTLTELYTGATHPVRLTRNVIDRERGVHECTTCNGKGSRIQATSFVRFQKTCEACGGRGQMFSQSTINETLDVHIPKGARDGHKISFSGKADDIQDGEPGDMIISVAEQPHSDFKRRGELRIYDIYI